MLVLAGREAATRSSIFRQCVWRPNGNRKRSHTCTSNKGCGPRVHTKSRLLVMMLCCKSRAPPPNPNPCIFLVAKASCAPNSPRGAMILAFFFFWFTCIRYQIHESPYCPPSVVVLYSYQNICTCGELLSKQVESLKCLP